MSQILQTRTGAGAATSYIYGQSGERLFEFSGSTRTWDIADERGSLRSQVSDSGVPSGRASYSAYGLQSREGSLNSPFGYLGEQFDPTWDMGWMRDRWYATGYGFFLGRDTLHNGENPYRYAYDSPLQFADRNGQCVPGITPGCQWIGSWRDVNYGDAERFILTGAQTAGDILTAPVSILEHAATAEGAAEYWRGWGAVWNHPLWSAQTILQAQLEPFGEVYQGFLCGDEEAIARGLVGSAFALWGADELLARGGKWFGKGEMRELAFASEEPFVFAETDEAFLNRILAESQPVVTELGWGAVWRNGHYLQDLFPEARVVAIDIENHASLARRQADVFGLQDIEAQVDRRVMDMRYPDADIAGKADLVVVVAPGPYMDGFLANTTYTLEAGLEVNRKAGGAILIVTDLEPIATRIANKYGVTKRYVDAYEGDLNSGSAGRVIVNTSLGIPLESQQALQWEVYVPATDPSINQWILEHWSRNALKNLP